MALEARGWIQRQCAAVLSVIEQTYRSVNACCEGSLCCGNDRPLCGQGGCRCWRSSSSALAHLRDARLRSHAIWIHIAPVQLLSFLGGALIDLGRCVVAPAPGFAPLEANACQCDQRDGWKESSGPMRSLFFAEQKSHRRFFDPTTVV